MRQEIAVQTLDQLYVEHQTAIKGIANKFARRYRRETDEIVSRAHLIFVQLAREFDASKGDFGIRLLHLLPLRLTATLRTDNSIIHYDTRRASPGFKFVSCELLNDIPQSIRSDGTEFDYGRVESRISPDAGEVLQAVKNLPVEVTEEIVGASDDKRILAGLRRYLRKSFGWSDYRAKIALAELCGCV